MRDFDEQRHTEIDLRWRKFISGSSNTAQKRLDAEFTLAWLGLKYRYMSADAHSLQFRELWLKYGRTPAPEFVYLQDREFTEFHSAALSSIETGCYALYMIAAKFNPILLPSTFVRSLRDASPRSCERQLTASLANSSVQQFFTGLLKDANYDEVLEIRNVSDHKTVLSRNVNGGSWQEEIILSEKRVPLDGEFTEMKRIWLCERIAEIMNVADFSLRTYGV